MVNKYKLNDKLIQKGKDFIEKETIETFIMKAEKHIQEGNLMDAMKYLVAVVAKFPNNSGVLALKKEYEDNLFYKDAKKIYERIHDVKI